MLICFKIVSSYQNSVSHHNYCHFTAEANMILCKSIRKLFIKSINLLVLQILTVQICKARRLLYMKATGIVRRVDEYGIIGQTSRKPHKH